MLRPSCQKCCWSTSQAVYLLYQSWPSLEKKALWKKILWHFYFTFGLQEYVSTTLFISQTPCFINLFNIELYLWCVDLAPLLAWFMSSDLPFIISCIPIFYFNFIEYHLLISTQTNDLLFWSILHSLRQMQICCLCRSQSNLCSWQCPDFSLWKFLTTKLCCCVGESCTQTMAKFSKPLWWIAWNQNTYCHILSEEQNNYSCCGLCQCGVWLWIW